MFLNYFSDKERDCIETLSKKRTNMLQPLAPFISRLGFTPNMLSLCGVFLLVPYALVFQTSPVVGALLLILYVVIDGVDGAYARLTGQSTQGGALTDIFCDQLGILVVTLCLIYSNAVNATVGAYYIAVYLVMIALSVNQNALEIPMQTIFRSKYIVYVMYAIRGIWGLNLLWISILVFAVIHTVSCVQSFCRIKRYLDQPGGTADLRDAPADSQPVVTIPVERKALGVVVMLAFMLAFTLLGVALHFQWFSSGSQSRALTVDWKTEFLTPEYKEGYIPQGLTSTDELLYFSAHRSDKGSRVYRFNADGTISGHFDMPQEAVHTSGLSAFNKRLFAVDYKSNTVYEMDAAASFAGNTASVTATFSTGLNGSSGCCHVSHHGRDFLIISDFKGTATTYLVDVEKALKAGSMKSAIVGKYSNHGFSQGVVHVNGLLFESESVNGKGVIYIYSLKWGGDETGYSPQITPLGSVNAPGTGGEDLGYFKDRLWVSDENSNKMYSADVTGVLNRAGDLR